MASLFTHYNLFLHIDSSFDMKHKMKSSAYIEWEQNDLDALSLTGYFDNEEVILHANIGLTQSPSVVSMPR
jgi:hypothetical protein